MIPYGRQNISQTDIDAVVDVLNSENLTQGPAVPAFEAVVASRVGAAHAVAVEQRNLRSPHRLPRIGARKGGPTLDGTQYLRGIRKLWALLRRQRRFRRY